MSGTDDKSADITDATSDSSLLTYYCYSITTAIKQADLCNDPVTIAN